MANNEFTIPIPARLKNVAKGGHVAGADQIIDDALGKEQSVINQEVSEAIEGNTEAVAAERQRAVAAEGALDTRLSDVEELAKISIDGGEAKIATGEDFHNPTAEQRAKVTTVGAILDGADDEPIPGSENLVKSGGVDDFINGVRAETKNGLSLANRTCFPFRTPKVLEGLFNADGSINTNFGNYFIYTFNIPTGVDKLYLSISGTADLNQPSFAIGRFILAESSYVAIPTPFPTKTEVVNYEIAVPANAVQVQLESYNGAVTVSCVRETRPVQLNPIMEDYTIEDIKELTTEIVSQITYKGSITINWTDDSTFWYPDTDNTHIRKLSGYSSYKAGYVDCSELVGKSIEIRCISNNEDNTIAIGNAFINDDNEIVGSYFQIKPSVNPFTIVVPDGATKLCVTSYKPLETDEDGVFTLIALNEEVKRINSEVEELKNKEYFKNNQWYGKKILWLGTSIPWGQSSEDEPGTHRVENPYPKQVCETLGATLIDSTHGGLAQMAYYDEYAGQWVPKPYTQGQTATGGSTSLTIQECQAATTLGYPDVSAYSYENTLLGKNADLYVFDVEPNNKADGSAADLALFDWRLWKYTDNSTFASHRGTYAGALIYEIDQLLTEKPNAVIVFVGEYVLMGLTEYMNPYAVREQSLSLCEKFHIHYIDLAEKLGYNGKNVSQWINTDNVHPKRAAYDRMAKMLINELLLIA